jgi:hypothetical protein
MYSVPLHYHSAKWAASCENAQKVRAMSPQETASFVSPTRA